MSRCPKCEQVTNVVVDSIRAHDTFSGKTWPAVIFLCDKCQTILGVSLDPEWQATQIVAGRLKMVDSRTGSP